MVGFATAVLCTIFAPFGAFCLVWSMIFLLRSDYLSAVVAMGAASFSLGLVAMLVLVVFGRVTPRISNDDAGATIRPDMRVDCLLLIATTGAFVAMACYAISAPQGWLSIPVAHRDDRYYVLVCAIGVVVGVFSLQQILKARGTSYIRLTVDGIETATMTSTVRQSWDDVISVADKPQNGNRPTGATYITTVDGRTRTLPSNWYTPGGRALRKLIRFYWRNPARRGELVDARIVQRLQIEAPGAV